MRSRVVLVLFLIEHHTMKAYWESGGIAHALLTSALDGGEWSASLPGRFTPRERERVIYTVGNPEEVLEDHNPLLAELISVLNELI
jgi:hypothetical protein